MIGSKKASATVWVIVIALIVIVAAGIYYFSTSSSSYTNTGYDGNTNKANPEQTRIVMGITDAAANMGSVSSVVLTVDQVEAHSTSQGWVTVSSQTKNYDLLELKSSGSIEMLGEANVKAGVYDQFRMRVTKVVVVDANGSHEAKLPSNELKIFSELAIKENSTATATFDFIADESLHVTGKGEYILAPVVEVEAREEATVEEKSNNRIEISKGKVRSKSKVGMDLNGNMGVGLRIASDAKIDLGVGGVIKVNGKSSSQSNASMNDDSGLNIGLGSSTSGSLY